MEGVIQAETIQPLLGAYRLVGKLGQGGMCDVLLAAKNTDRIDFTKLVVIKKLREEFTSESEFVTMFLDEVRLAARLNHPNVVQTLEVGVEGSNYFLVMEYLDGQSLNRIFPQMREMPLGMRLTILSDMLSGIHYAHELKDYDGSPLHIVHRDLTPHNVFVTYDGHVKVVDFGIAKSVGREAETETGVFKGKVRYMAPEQVMAVRDIDRRADVFSAGVMLCEAATRSRFWGDVDSTMLLQQLLNGTLPPSPRERDPEISVELDAICRKAIALERDDRYATAAELQEALDEYIAKREKRASPREIATAVSSHFADDRKRARQIIQEQLGGVASTKRPSPKERISGIVDIDLSSGQSISHSESSLIPTLTAMAASTDKSDAGTEAHTKADVVAAPAQRKSSRRRLGVMMVTALAAALSAAAVGLWVVGRVLGFTPAAIAPSQVTLTLRATPLEATFQLDEGTPLENPYIARVPCDHLVHTVRASAPGYEAKTESVRLDNDRAVRFALVKELPP